MKKKIAVLLCLFALSASAVNAQETEVKISLNEQFFETLLEAVFENLNEPSVPLSIGAELRGEPNNSGDYSATGNDAAYMNAAFETSQAPAFGTRYPVPSTYNSACDETVRLKKEIDGVRTAVRFRNGKILAPIAFEGNYSPPLIGCIGFSGWAETTINLSFDKSKNALIGNAKVLSVNLSGTNGIGGSIITRLVQNSIDRKINPLEIVNLNMLSFTAPIQNTGKLRMEAVGIRHIVGDREIDVFLKYKFMKAGGK